MCCVSCETFQNAEVVGAHEHCCGGDQSPSCPTNVQAWVKERAEDPVDIVEVRDGKSTEKERASCVHVHATRDSKRVRHAYSLAGRLIY